MVGEKKEKMEHVANQITKLRGIENWNIWKFQIIISLKAKQCYGIVNGTEKLPELSDSLTAAAKVLKEEERSEWIKRDNKAQEIIVTRMEEGPLTHVLSCTNSAEIWGKLLTIYEQKSEISIHLVQQKFYNLKYENQGISTFISKVEKLKDQLSQLGENISEQMMMTKILISLPEEFKHFVSAWESVPNEKQNINELTSRLMIEEERVKQNSNETGRNNCALATKSDGKCFECGKPGHLKRDCFRLKNPEKPTCYVCKRRGHVAKVCRYRKKSSNDKNANEKRSNAFMTTAEDYSGEVNVIDWIIDSGATEHMCCNIELFTKFEQLKENKIVKIGDGSCIKAVGVGKVCGKTYDGKNWINTELRNVLYVPDLKMNLFSVSSMLDKNYFMKSNKYVCKIVNASQQVCAIAEREGKLYKLKFKVDKHVFANVSTEKENLQIWHEKLAHQNVKQVKDILLRYNIDFTNEEFVCENCILGKAHRLPFPTSSSKTTKTCEIIHVDLCGPMEEESLGGSKYFLLIKDDYSHFRTVYFLKRKSEVTRKMEIFLNLAESVTGNRVKVVRSDNGREFVNSEIRKLFEDKGIRHQKTVPYTPEQNGKCEREMRTIVETGRTLLKAAKLEKQLWAEAINFGTYVLNRTGTSTVKEKSPYELWYGSEVNIKNFKVFGSEVYSHIPNQKRGKWDEKAKRGVFVGYDENTKGYRIFYEQDNTVEIARDVIFTPRKSQFLNEIIEDTSDIENEINKQQEEMTDKSTAEPKQLEEKENENGVEIEEETESRGMNLRNRYQLKKPSKYDDYEICLAGLTKFDEPNNFEEAMKGNDKIKWQEAVKIELNTLKENNTWEIVKKPNNCKIIDNKWIFKIKIDDEGKPGEYKARLVARGFQQADDIDFAEIYAPVAKLTTLRILIAVANKLNLSIHQMDVKSAFLYGDIKDTVYMKIPEGVVEEKDKVCKLNKAIYGLKKSPKCWYEKFNQFIENEGFKRSLNDYCLYIKEIKIVKLYVLLYVDDLLIFSSDSSVVNGLKGALMRMFKMKDMGLVKNYLGINIDQDLENKVIKINQINYLKRVLERFNMQECNSVSTPMDPKFKIENSESRHDQDLETKCRSLIGCLMYAMVGSRPDICAAISFLSRFQGQPSETLWNSLKRVLRYINGTLNLNLVYKNSNVSDIITGYCDADWGGDLQDRKSTTGYMFTVYGACVSWASRKQKSVALSSCEAEYIALSQSTSEGCWIRSILLDLDVIDNSVSIHIYCDNESAIRVAKNPENHKRLKHVDIHWHFVRDKVSNGIVKLSHIRGNEQTADIFTKPLHKQLFVKFRNNLNLY